MPVAVARSAASSSACLVAPTPFLAPGLSKRSSVDSRHLRVERCVALHESAGRLRHARGGLRLMRLGVPRRCGTPALGLSAVCVQLAPFGPRSRSYECAAAAGRRRGGRFVVDYDGAVRCGVCVGVACRHCRRCVCFASGDRGFSSFGTGPRCSATQRLRETFAEAGAFGWAVLRWAVVCCAGVCGWWLCVPSVCPLVVVMGGVRAADPFWSHVSL